MLLITDTMVGVRYEQKYSESNSLVVGSRQFSCGNGKWFSAKAHGNKTLE